MKNTKIKLKLRSRFKKKLKYELFALKKYEIMVIVYSVSNESR